MKHALLWVCILLNVNTFAQSFTREDSLRGSITKERAWWDLKYYDLEVSVFPETQTIGGRVVVKYQVLQAHQVMQIDLQPPLSISKITQGDENLSFTKDGRNAYLIALKKRQQVNNIESLTIHYSGKPVVAKHPPWEGGIQWEKDAQGNDFIATSCQGLGASVWWPCKDHMYDEPEGMTLKVTVPKHLMDVSNGRLTKVTDNNDNTKTYEWTVKNPINNYGVNLNIGNYVHFADTLNGEKGKLDLDFYVLPENLEKAKTQFKQAKLMLRAFEHWFGAYPFYEDGYKLVEVPYLGMEHQSSVTYGNKYQNGYLGKDFSGTGYGLKFDFIIIHESGHEWFANNITYKDMADMWIHESFTNYSESLYIEYYYGKEAAAAYIIGNRKGIKNDKPIQGPYGVNESGSGDMYVKGGNILHTLRQVVQDDALWRTVLRDMNKTFYHATVDGKDIEQFISKKAGRDLSKIFDQYLRTTQVPTLEYSFHRGKISYRWVNCVKGFDMPVRIRLKDKGSRMITPSPDWQTTRMKSKEIDVDPNFYVNVSRIEHAK
ncbi:M1 family metallopeptidase [Pseudochryseolinea flava]|uniref:M1 family peptidase n=1 Tax=Pseudochryseolinea flava TaxID=2059302 RepID=A0A364XY54_9BACT|nr:M1 family metallopeptidase [Pseudochryseolinea flava]RAV98732.1 M1 family peptidase [Pseudochryseolinea flava]